MGIELLQSFTTEALKWKLLYNQTNLKYFSLNAFASQMTTKRKYNTTRQHACIALGMLWFWLAVHSFCLCVVWYLCASTVCVCGWRLGLCWISATPDNSLYWAFQQTLDGPWGIKPEHQNWVALAYIPALQEPSFILR